MTWCLNTAHGAAELGRVTWDDLFLHQDHPWRSQGLHVDAGGDWMGFLRPKSDVLGWWRLWPETVALIEEWKPEAERLLGRKIKDTDRLILTEAGLPIRCEVVHQPDCDFGWFLVANDSLTVPEIAFA